MGLNGKMKERGRERRGAARRVRVSCLGVKWSFLGWQNGCRSRSSELIWWIWSTRREVRHGYEDGTPSANACGLLRALKYPSMLTGPVWPPTLGSRLYLRNEGTVLHVVPFWLLCVM